jgi:hypothetical protein
MSGEFVERRDGSFYPWESRVPLGHLVREYPHGESPETIRSHYPTLSLDQVNGAIAFYLGHQDEVERDIAEREREEDEYSAAHPMPPDLKGTFARMRQQLQARRSR